MMTSCSLVLLAAAAITAADDSYQSALIAAVHHFARVGELEHLRALLDRHPNLVDAPERFRQPHKPSNGDGYTPLQDAARDGRDEAVSYLIGRGADVNAADNAGWTALHMAAQQGHLAIVKRLVEHGARLEAKTAAVSESDSSALAGAPPSSPADAKTRPVRFPALPARTALDWAIAANRTEVANYLRSLTK